MEQYVMITCGNLAAYAKLAMEKVGISIPLIVMDKKLHNVPEELWNSVFKKMNELPEDITVLLGYGTCGCKFFHREFPRKTVIPRVDDCVSMLMTTKDNFQYNMKKRDAFYLSSNREYASIAAIQRSCIDQYGEEDGALLMKKWFNNIKKVVMIDTGLGAADSAQNEARLKEEAAIIGADCEHVQGSNIILEKLISRKWDVQFKVVEKGQCITEEDFKNSSILL